MSRSSENAKQANVGAKQPTDKASKPWEKEYLDTFKRKFNPKAKDALAAVVLGQITSTLKAEKENCDCPPCQLGLGLSRDVIEPLLVQYHAAFAPETADALLKILGHVSVAMGAIVSATVKREYAKEYVQNLEKAFMDGLEIGEKCADDPEGIKKQIFEDNKDALKKMVMDGLTAPVKKSAR